MVLVFFFACDGDKNVKKTKTFGVKCLSFFAVEERKEKKKTSS